MKPIAFTASASQKVYADYIKRIKRVTKPLDKEDSKEVLMELNSHIYESFQRQSHPDTSEIDTLLAVLEKLGAPEEVLKPVVADLKLKQATKTFNPLHVFKALFLNLSNGIFYIFMSILYLFLFVFVFLIGAKIWNPENVGMYFKDGKFQVLGSLSNTSESGIQEVLGNWFIPVMVIVTIVWYLLITLLLRLKRKKK